MLPFSKTLMSACLGAIRVLCWVVAGLLVALIVVQYFRGDADANPAQIATYAGVMFVLGWICSRVVRLLAARP